MAAKPVMLAGVQVPINMLILSSAAEPEATAICLQSLDIQVKELKRRTHALAQQSRPARCNGHYMA